ncbi:MAG: DNA-binding protein WhiA [Clostridiales bacterium]|nr:DNA-binding protein WhiA [Clostridiales bacterium]
MSFSSDVKEELSRQISTARHCQTAEIAAIISLSGKIAVSEDDKYSIKVHTENVSVARKYFTLVKKTFNINTEISIRQNASLKKRRTYTLTASDHEDSIRILQATKLIDTNMEMKDDLSLVDNLVIQQICCKRSFIRGAFLAAGSISAPEKSYHFEIVCDTLRKATQLQEIIKTFEVDAKIIGRKKHFVVYIKEGTQIVEILNVMEAHVALMDLENIRILKDMRNTVNRKVNCETANISKTVSAAIKQIEDIKYIRDTVGFEELSDGLKEIALLRLEQPEATLRELGEMLDQVVGKSGVNHRLRKLSIIAESLRENKEEKDL